MFAESSMLPQCTELDRRWPDKSGDETGRVEQLLAFLLSLAITGVVTVAMPLALLHLR